MKKALLNESHSKPYPAGLFAALGIAMILAILGEPVARAASIQKSNPQHIKSIKKLRPQWSGKISRIGENSSYLSQTEGALYRSGWSEMEERMFDARWTKSARQRYEDLNRQYEMQRQYGIVKAHSDTGHIRENMNLAGRVMNEALNQEVRSQITFMDLNEKASKHPSAERLFAPVKKYQSKEEWSEPLVRFVPRTDWVGMRSQLWIQNSLADTYVDVVAAPWLDRGAPMVQGVINRVPRLIGLESANLDRQNGERVRFSLARSLPIWNLQSGMTYGVSSTIFSASLTKHLTPNLRAVVSQSQGADPIRSGLNGQTDNRLSVFYDFRF